MMIYHLGPGQKFHQENKKKPKRSPPLISGKTSSPGETRTSVPKTCDFLSFFYGFLLYASVNFNFLYINTYFFLGSRMTLYHVSGGPSLPGAHKLKCASISRSKWGKTQPQAQREVIVCAPEAYNKNDSSPWSPRPATWSIRLSKDWKKSRFSTFPFGFQFFFSYLLFDFCMSGIDKYLAKVIFDSIIIKAAWAPKEYFMLRLSVIRNWPQNKVGPCGVCAICSQNQAKVLAIELELLENVAAMLSRV